MNIREPEHFHPVQKKRSRKHRAKRASKTFLILIVIAVLFFSGFYYLSIRPYPPAKATAILPVGETSNVSVRWPMDGTAAFGVLNQGVLDATKDQKQGPIASVSKVMVAIAVLKQHPLQLGEQGPNITITQKDVDIYNSYVAKDGSVVPVYVGEKLTERQALEALMLPSANNIADLLATWAYGSVEEYHVAANHIAQTIGMTNTKFSGDASGYSAQNVSTARDLVMMGQAALNNPVLREIVSQKTASIPNVGTITNTNQLLGRNGIEGIKTGNTDEAGGCYLFAADVKLGDNKSTTIIGAVMNAPDLNSAMSSSIPLLDSIKAGFAERTVVKAGQSVGQYAVPWGGSVEVVAAKDVVVYGWKASNAVLKLDANSLTGEVPAGTTIGSITGILTNSTASSPVIIKEAVVQPSLRWRMTRL